MNFLLCERKLIFFGMEKKFLIEYVIGYSLTSHMRKVEEF